MKERDSDFWPSVLAIVILFALVGGGRLIWANWQASVWQKQGVPISTGEVFFGIRPAGMPAKL